jgi:energy-coupling factor transporter ATP-binding protein EcfA2
MDDLIRLRSVTYSYPNREAPALYSIDLSIAAGEFLLVTGPSGSGKSTLLRTLNGLVPHFSGGTISGDVLVKDLPAVEVGPSVLSQYVGFVSQNPEAQTILEKVEPEIAFAMENAAVPVPEMRKRVNEIVDLLNLASLRSRPMNTLSGGERQRVAIACALVLKPEILVLDEPTSQLDPQSAAELLHVLADLNETLGLTIVLAEHRLDRVLSFADRLAYFENGRLMIHDTVRKTLFHIPQLPPVIELAKQQAWEQLPLSLEEASDCISPPPLQNLKRKQEISPSSAEIDPLLEVDGLQFSYTGNHLVLDGIDLQVRPGEVLAIVGANGSGKSTLLRCIVGLLQPANGDILFNGRSLLGRDTADLARQIAYLPQYPDDLLFAETVRQELEVTLHNHDLVSESRIGTALDNLNLVEHADDYPRDLSTGQRQRVALGAITVTRPRLLLLDEPTRGQDAQIKQQLLSIWRGWKADGMGLIIVTHDVELVVQLADSAVILSEGKIESSGPIKNVLANSSTFAPQIARLFPGSGWLTVDDAVDGLEAIEMAARDDDRETSRRDNA